MQNQDNVKCSNPRFYSKMGEFEEFAEALFGQLSVEIDEEKEFQA